MASGNTSLQTQNIEDKLPFIPEYDVEYEGGPNSTLRYINCTKNPGHLNFIPIKQFKMEHLPKAHRTDDMMSLLKYVSDRTVRIVVRYTSLERPDNYLNSDIRGSSEHTLFGTGFQYEALERVSNQRCLCPDCKNSDNPKMEFLKVSIVTARHIVFDQSEAEHTVIEFWYDSEDRDNVIKFFGLAVLGLDERNPNLDCAAFICVTHDVGLYKMLSESVLFVDKSSSLLGVCTFPFIVSHPHGLSKQVTIGTDIHLVCKVPVITTNPTDEPPFKFKLEDGRKCRLSKTHNKAASLELFQKLVDSNDTPCEARVVYTLKEGLTLFSNPSTFWLCLDNFKLRPRDRDHDLRKFVRFPPDAEFTYGNKGDHLISFPDIDFEVTKDEHEFLWERRVEYYWEYNIDTCCGSSGAAVFGGGGSGMHPNILLPHAGWDKDLHKNRTGRLKRPLAK